jgi:3-oxoacyl-[acyl-carrier protein] reductase
MPDDWFQRMLDIHAVAPFRMCRAVAPHWREAARAELADGREVHRKIVNVSSVSGTMGNAAQVSYAAGKAAVVGLTKTLAKEWGQFKINVNAVAFGFIDTRMTRPTTGETAEISGAEVRVGIPEGFRDSLMSRIALGRFGRPEEAAGGVVFLCSPWSDYVTGQVLTVNGGYQMGMTE